MFIKLSPTKDKMLQCPVYLDKNGMFTLQPVSVSKTAGRVIIRQHKALSKEKFYTAELIEEHQKEDNHAANQLG